MADSVLVAKNVIIRTAALERAYKSRTGGISMEKLTTAGTYKSNRGNGNYTTFAGMWKSVGKGYDCRI